MWLQRTIAFLLLLAFFTSTFSRLFVVADYYVNTDRYYKNCVNKSKPQLKCNGKCQMSKKIQAEEQKDQKNPGVKLDLKSELVTQSGFAFTLPPVQVSSSLTFPSYRKGPLAAGFNDRIFHPPIF